MKKNAIPNAKNAVRLLTAKTMKSSKRLLSMAGRSGRNQAGCCG